MSDGSINNKLIAEKKLEGQMPEVPSEKVVNKRTPIET